MEIQKEKAKLKRIQWWDHRLAHSITWLSVLASFTATIMVAFKKELCDKSILTAVIAGIPGLMIAIDKAFDFGRRSHWDIMFEIGLQKILDEIELTETDTFELAKKYSELRESFESSYFKIGFFSNKQGK